MEWQEHRSPDGRVYWYNTNNQQSVWDKPDALKTPQDKALDSTNWKQYESQGKHYYVHKSTQETTWDQPEEVAQALAALPSASNSPAPPAFVPQQNTNMAMQPGGGALVGMGFSGPAAPSSNPQQQQPVPYNMQPDYVLWSTNPQAAMQAFKDLLKQAGVNPQWTWEQTMRTIITAPAYKALKTGDERRAAFEDYQKELVETAKEKRKGRLAQLKPAWREALAQASEMGMKSWWPWTKTAQMLSTEFSEVWRMTRDDTDRKELWQDYVDELKAKESKREKEVQQRNVAKLNRLLDSVDLNEHSTWRDTRRTIERSKEFANDAELQQTLDPNDFLDLFEERLNKLESTLQEKRLKTREDKKRQVRKHREAFAGLLEDLREDKKIKSGTTWPDIWPHVKDDERLHNMLGNPGSSPLELFWDVVDELDERVEEHCRAIEGAFAQNKITIDLNTTWEQFQEHLQSEAVQPKVRNVDQEAREGAFNMIHDRFVKLAAEEKRRAEKKLRNNIDDLRYAIRDLEPPVEIDSSWEEVQPRLTDLKEYQALPDDESRKTAFDKYIIRAKERKEAKEAEERELAEREATQKARRRERERERAQYEDSPRRSSGRDRDRERERDYHRSSSHRHRSQSVSVQPEEGDTDMTGPSHRERERERDRHRRERDRKRSPSLDARDFERAALRARREERPNPRAERERERGSSRDLKRPPPTHAGSSASGGRPRAVSPDAMLRYGSPEEEDEGDSKPNKKRKTDKDVGGSRKERQESAEEGEI